MGWTDYYVNDKLPDIDYLYEKGVSLIDNGSGVKYFLYVPDNVNADTDIFLYKYGSGVYHDLYSKWHDSRNYQIIDGVLQHGSDSVIIMPCIEDDINWGKISYDIVEDVRNNYGIVNNNLTASGFSAGGAQAIYASGYNIYNNDIKEPEIVFMIDDYSYAYKSPKGVLEEYMVEDKRLGDILKDNQSIIFFYEGSNKSDYESNTFADYGLNVIKVECEDSKHVNINSNFFENNVFNFRNGNSVLPNEGYVYKVRSSEGVWEEIDVNEINTVDRLYGYFGFDSLDMKLKHFVSLNDINKYGNDLLFEEVDNEELGKYNNLLNLGVFNTNCYNNSSDVITNDSNYVDDFNNNIVGLIKNDNIFNLKKINVNGGLGPIANSINEIISLYTNSIGKLLNLLSLENEAIHSVSQLMVDMDSYLKDKVINEFGYVENKNLTNNMFEDNIDANETFVNNDNSNRNYPNIHNDKYNLNSNYNKEIIYENDRYNLIIKQDNSGIISMKYQYEYTIVEHAKYNFDLLTKSFKDNKYIDSIILNGNNLNIMFNKDLFNGININDVNDELLDLNIFDFINKLLEIRDDR